MPFPLIQLGGLVGCRFGRGTSFDGQLSYLVFGHSGE